MKCLVCCIKPEHFGGPGQLMHGPFAATTLRSKLAEMQALSMSSPGMEEASLLLEASLAAEAGRFDEAQACYQRADAILAELGMTMTRHMMRQHPAEFALREGHPAEAARSFRESYDGLGEARRASARRSRRSSPARSTNVASSKRLAIEGETVGSSAGARSTSRSRPIFRRSGDCLPRPRARTPPGGSGRRGSRVRRAGD
jgi:hypothetical protein